MSSYSTPARVRFPRSAITGDVPAVLAPGSFAVNWSDRKVYVGGPAGEAVLFSHYLDDWNVTKAYRKGDYVIRDGDIRRARRDLTAGTAFIDADWDVVTGSDRAKVSEPFASSVLNGGGLSIVGGSITVAAGAGYVVDAIDPRVIEATLVEWPSVTLTLPDTADNWFAIGIDPAGVVVAAPVTAPEALSPVWRRQNILLGFALTADGTGAPMRVEDASAPPATAAEAMRDAYAVGGGMYRARGLLVTPGAAAQLRLSEGVLFGVGINWRDAPASPNVKEVAQKNPIPVWYSTQNALEGAPSTSLKLGQWDDAGVLKTVPAGSATIQYLAIDVTGAVYAQYGQTVYPSATAALTAVASDWAGLSKLMVAGNVAQLCAVIGVPGATADATIIVTAANLGDPYNIAPAGETSQYLLRDGSRALTGPLDFAGQKPVNADIDGSASKIRPARYTATGVALPGGTAADVGQIGLNVVDRKLFATNGAGDTIILADRILNHDPARAYAAADIVVKDGGFYQAKASIGPKAFAVGDWNTLGSNGANVIATGPTTVDQNTISTAGRPTVKPLVLQGDSAQTAALLTVPGTAVGDTRAATIDATGFPVDRFAPNITRIVQASHGFSYRGQAVAYSAGQWQLADASDPDLNAIAVIEQVLDSNTFVLRTGGIMTQLQDAAFAGGSITAGALYYVSDTVPGRLTTTPSTIRPDPVLVATGNRTGVVLAGGGSVSDEYLKKAGDTMVGALTMPAGVQLRFADGNTTLHKAGNSPSLQFRVSGVLAARVDEDDTALATAQSLITRKKGDARYIQAVGATAADSLTVTGADAAVYVGGGGIQQASWNLRIILPDDIDGAAFYGGSGGADVAASAATILSRRMGDARYLQLSGGALTGKLTLDGAPTANLHAATKKYVDDATASSLTQSAADNRYALRSRSISSGTGLSGGGDLTSNRSLSFDTSWGDARYLRADGSKANSQSLNGRLNIQSQNSSDIVLRLYGGASDTITGTFYANGNAAISGKLSAATLAGGTLEVYGGSVHGALNQTGTGDILFQFGGTSVARIARDGALDTGGTVVTRAAGDARYASCIVGAVGSYAMLSVTSGGNVAAGDTVSGSRLRYACAGGSSGGGPSSSTVWMAAGIARTDLDDESAVTLFVRIS